MIAEVRRWFDSRGFVEVETPVLQPLYGGALARPFTTHHNALDRDLYLRIATELYLKRLVVGGIDKVYELGKDFRNEGISHKHNPEFTMLEWYEAYATTRTPPASSRAWSPPSRTAVLGTTKIEREGETIDLAPALAAGDAPRRDQGADRDRRARAPLARAARRGDGSEADPEEGWGKLVDGLLSKEVEPTLIQPTFVVDYPVELLAVREAPPKRGGAGRALGGVRRRDRDRELVHRAERPRRAAAPVRAAGRGDGARRRGDPALRRDLHRGALEQGMPPTGGVGLGIDRLVMILTGAKTPAGGPALPGDAELGGLPMPALPKCGAPHREPCIASTARGRAPAVSLALPTRGLLRHVAAD